MSSSSDEARLIMSSTNRNSRGSSSTSLSSMERSPILPMTTTTSTMSSSTAAVAATIATAMDGGMQSLELEMEQTEMSPSTTTSPPMQHQAPPPLTITTIVLSLCIWLAGFHGFSTLFQPSEETIRARSMPLMTSSNGDVLVDFRYNEPLVDPPTIPSTLLKVTSFWLPLVVLVMSTFFIHATTRRRRTSVTATTTRIFPAETSSVRTTGSAALRNDMIRTICCLITATGMNELITNGLKVWVLRKRPNFFAQCGYDPTTHECTAPFLRLLESQLSFPSGHSSLSFCGLGIMTLWFLDRFGYTSSSSSSANWRPTRGSTTTHYYPLCFLPLCFAGFTAISRIVDYWHHPSDVLAGILLGSFCATITYQGFFPHRHNHNNNHHHANDTHDDHESQQQQQRP